MRLKIFFRASIKAPAIAGILGCNDGDEIDELHRENPTRCDSSVNKTLNMALKSQKTLDKMLNVIILTAVPHP